MKDLDCKQREGFMEGQPRAEIAGRGAVYISRTVRFVAGDRTVSHSVCQLDQRS